MKKINKVFTDRTDASLTVSLFEHGCIRNPKTNKVIYSCKSLSGLFLYDYTYVSIEELKEDLEETEQCYFDFDGSNREEAIKKLNNDYLTHHITGLNMYNSLYQQSCTWNYSLKSLLKEELI